MAVPGHVAGATGAGGRRGRGNAGAGCRQRSPVLASAKPGTSALGGAPWIHYFIPATEGKLSWERPGDLERPRGPVGQAGPATDLLWCSRTSFDVPPRGDQADEPIAEPRGHTFGKKPRCRVRWRSVHGHVADPSHPRSLIPPPGGSAPVFTWPSPSAPAGQRSACRWKGVHQPFCGCLRRHCRGRLWGRCSPPGVPRASSVPAHNRHSVNTSPMSK